jgi:protein-L-isoaspartate(D-aspartate) O-methyltransferase
MATDGNKEYTSQERHRMVKEQIEARGISNRALLAALEKVPRHLFIPLELREYAYSDQALPTYFNQTISQPYIVAKMTELLSLKKNDRVLEIGTGTGYQTAILAELTGEVYTMEIIPELHEKAKSNPVIQSYHNIHFILGDGYQGHPAAAPYNAIIVTAAPAYIPEALISQLAPKGRMVVPIGTYDQTLYLLTKDINHKVTMHPLLSVRFVPMIKK